MRIELFNLETMSGVFPGVRTQVYQRLFLRPHQDQVGQEDVVSADGVWAQLFWYDDPRSCVLFTPTGDTDADADGDTDANVVAVPAFRIESPQADQLLTALRERLAAEGQQLFACGSCAHWRQNRPPDTASDAGAENLLSDVPLGQCRWRADQDEVLDPRFCAQSGLALGCPQWENIGASAVSGANELRSSASSTEADTVPDAIPAQPLWQRAVSAISQRIRGTAPAQKDNAVSLTERSGVGAGTQPCFVCQGRIANLGALVVETPEEDQQTLSVWRCRLCHTYYLNNWIDRWVRLDNLETQERFYRLAPAEAANLLRRIDGVTGGDHPQGRAERGEQRNWFEAFMAQREPLSHQVKLGR